MIRSLLFALLVSAVPATALAQQPAPAQASSADAQLKALYDAYARWDAKEGGYDEGANGEPQPLGYHPRVDAASQEQRAAYRRAMLAKLDAISLGQLSPPEQVNAAVFRTILENAIASHRYRAFEIPFNSDSNFWTYLDSPGALADAEAYRRYIARMRDVPRFFDEQIANMRAGLARGFSVPKVTLAGRDQSIANFVTESPEKNAFYAAFESMPSTIPAAEQARLRAEANAAISAAVIPAYRKLLAFYRDDICPERRLRSPRRPPDGDPSTNRRCANLRPPI